MGRVSDGSQWWSSVGEIIFRGFLNIQESSNDFWKKSELKRWIQIGKFWHICKVLRNFNFCYQISLKTARIFCVSLYFSSGRALECTRACQLNLFSYHEHFFAITIESAFGIFRFSISNRIDCTSGINKNYIRFWSFAWKLKTLTNCIISSPNELFANRNHGCLAVICIITNFCSIENLQSTNRHPNPVFVKLTIFRRKSNYLGTKPYLIELNWKSKSLSAIDLIICCWFYEMQIWFFGFLKKHPETNFCQISSTLEWFRIVKIVLHNDCLSRCFQICLLATVGHFSYFNWISMNAKSTTRSRRPEHYDTQWWAKLHLAF